MRMSADPRRNSTASLPRAPPPQGPGFADPGMVAGQFEFDLGIRQQAEPVPNFQRDGHLALGRELYGITPTGKSNIDPQLSRVLPARNGGRETGRAHFV